MSLKKILVTNINQIEPKHVSPNEIYEFDRYDVSGLLHENKCTVTFYSLSPGKSNYPYHYHTQHKEKVLMHICYENTNRNYGLFHCL